MFRAVAHPLPEPPDGELRVGGTVEIEVPWTIDLHSPHHTGTMRNHFTIEQCVILCEFIEDARRSDETRRCRLVDRQGRVWFADFYPSRDGKDGHVQWFDPSRPRTALKRKAV